MKLSNQALGAIMLALQNSLINQSDIVPILRGFDLMVNENEEIMVQNPPIVATDDDDRYSIDESETTVGSD